MIERMKSYQLDTIEFTHNDMVKDHLRHLVSSLLIHINFFLYFEIKTKTNLNLQMGGRSNVENELLCRFIFPEKPAALVKFLDVISPRWNISLLHYRAQVSFW